MQNLREMLHFDIFWLDKMILTWKYNLVYKKLIYKKQGLTDVGQNGIRAWPGYSMINSAMFENYGD